MKLSECVIGIVVSNDNGDIGHISGLTHNICNKVQIQCGEFGEVIPMVHWSYDQYPKSIHHNNLKVYKG